MPAGSKPGEYRGGRRKGTRNKTTVEMKSAIEFVFAGLGGETRMLAWAEENIDLFYTRILVKIIPQNVHLAGADGEKLPQLVIIGQGAEGVMPERHSLNGKHELPT